MLVLIAATRIAAQPKGTLYLIYGLATAIVLEAGFAIAQRLEGIPQAEGTMSHQNSLGMATHFALFPCLSLLLAGRREAIIVFGFIGALICVVLTGSRASIGLAAAGVVILTVLSVAIRPSGKKMGIVAVVALALLAGAPVAYSGLSKRLSAESIASSDSERSAFKRAAWMIINDHPFGIGANQYVNVANTEGYSARAGVAWNSGSRSTNVHNTYLLMTAELGYIGGAAYIGLMLLPIWSVMRLAWANRRDANADLALGLAVTLLVVAAHCLYEWIYVTDPILYLHAICLGMAGGLIGRGRVDRIKIARARPSTSIAYGGSRLVDQASLDPPGNTRPQC